MLKRKMTQWLGWMVYISSVSVFLILTSCGGGQATPSPGAAETAEARRVLTTLTAEAQTTPTPSGDLEAVVQEAFEAWAKAQGEPYRDMVVRVGESDGYFTLVKVVAWFRPERDAPWEEREAEVECRLVGEEWQCNERFDFQLTAREVAQRTQATATAEAQATATVQTQVAATATAVSEHERVWEKDGSVTVWVPAGEFLMGSPPGEGYDGNEHPQHTVYVSEFWIDKTEVTNEQYGRCVAAGVCRALEGSDYRYLNDADHPVARVTWYDAQTYCEWAGKRLPTETEWEKAARGTDGREYPWGNSFDGSKLNFCDANCDVVWNDSRVNDGYQYSAPVGSYPADASPYGALDMGGNVREWCQDWYDAGYYTISPRNDPQGASSGEYRVVRGGSWFFNAALVRAATRNWGRLNDRHVDRGFRCVSQSPLPTPEPPTPTKPLPTAVPTREQVWEADGSVMVNVPAGEFLMGSKDDPDADYNEHPQHTVYVSEFWIDKTEVTNAQYRKCVETGTCRAPTTCSWGEPTYSDSSKADHPVVCVSWQDAKAYCEWAGKRFPTEAEWEKAARGTDGRKYPWGEVFDCQRGNFDDETEVDGYVVPGGEGCDGYVRTAPVGSFASGASPYGVLDMAGNVWEWCQDWYDGDYYASSPQRDPQGSSSGTSRAVRGGSWGGNEGLVRAAFRGSERPGGRYDDLGFRCVSQSP